MAVAAVHERGDDVRILHALCAIDEATRAKVLDLYALARRHGARRRGQVLGHVRSAVQATRFQGAAPWATAELLVRMLTIYDINLHGSALFDMGTRLAHSCDPNTFCTGTGTSRRVRSSTLRSARSRRASCSRSRTWGTAISYCCRRRQGSDASASSASCARARAARRPTRCASCRARVAPTAAAPGEWRSRRARVGVRRVWRPRRARRAAAGRGTGAVRGGDARVPARRPAAVRADRLSSGVVARAGARGWARGTGATRRACSPCCATRATCWACRARRRSVAACRAPSSCWGWWRRCSNGWASSCPARCPRRTRRRCGDGTRLVGMHEDAAEVLAPRLPCCACSAHHAPHVRGVRPPLRHARAAPPRRPRARGGAR